MLCGTRAMQACLALCLAFLVQPLTASAQAPDAGAYTARADVLPIGDDPEAPTAEIFYTAYTLDGADPAERPITFLFNGGPGAASVFLHLGAVGPRMLELAGDGSIPPQPSRLVANDYNWLDFTDLVFVDPVGTGYSRALPPENEEMGETGNGGGEADPEAYWDAEADLESIGQFMRLYLTRFDRWPSPKVIAGESYGGLRVAALSRVLMEDFEIILNGAVLVSPALDYGLLLESERHSLLHWAMVLPSLAATADLHGRAALPVDADDLGPRIAPVETFALTDYLTGLAGLGRMSDDETAAFYGEVAALTGLDVDTVQRLRGRIGSWRFAKLLLQDEGQLVDRYDATQVSPDPYPDLSYLEGGDRSLTLLDGVFASALLDYVRDELGYETDRTYEVLNEDTFRSWSFDSGISGRQGYVRTTDDLAYALTLNDGLQVLIVHGYHDLITPYLASRYLIDQTVIEPNARARVRFANYFGGHMFYFHDESLRAFHADVAALFDAL